MAHTDHFQILSLSGGGYRGLYAAQILARLEEKAGPIARHFDLLCGTSVGGILALALALEIPAARLVELLTIEGEAIFGGQRRQRRLRRGRFWDRWLPPGTLRAIHEPNHLKTVLSKDENLGSRLLGDCLHRVIVPTVNFTTALPQIFKTPHHPTFQRDHLASLVDVALATSAAPIYFPHHRFDNQIFVDGGLIANGPALFGVHEAEHFLKVPIETVHVLAIGTLQIDATASAGFALNRGLKGWGKGLFNLTIAAQERAMNQLVEHRLGNRFMAINDTLTRDQVDDVGLDLADSQARQTLLGRAEKSFRHALRERVDDRFLNHSAPVPRFHFGPRAAAIEGAPVC